MFGHIVCCTMSFDVWHTLELLFTTQSKSRIVQLRFQPQSLKKGNLSIHDYILKMTNLAQKKFAARQLITDEKLILYILGGLGHDYDSVVINLTSCHDVVTLQEVQFLLQSQEMRLEQLNTPSSSVDLPSPSANFASHFRRSATIGGVPPSYIGVPRRDFTPRGRGHGRGSRVHRPVCQLCNCVGHVAMGSLS
ncbi:uncharacterized protein LOC133832809 [Humulus lupulus]|uniref:uncharacterized protein LOC133832809 n=1 Tax=Humulus lupulus TaxID=3486 RepID=UPI002B40056D|nr:uncharacterized protein LOC133832809 [Humulus lupulus]